MLKLLKTPQKAQKSSQSIRKNKMWNITLKSLKSMIIYAFLVQS